jgi:peptide/nickel transport system substrate-binding protein
LADGYELDTGTSKIKPYDPTVGQRIADTVRPQFGDAVPTDQEAINKSFGYGWWKRTQGSRRTAYAAGFTQQGGQWMMPTASRSFTLKTFTEGVINRLGTDIAQQWTQAGVQVHREADPVIYPNDLPMGQYEAATAWSIETWAATRISASSSIAGIRISSPRRASGRPRVTGKRWSDPRLDAIIEKVRSTDFTRCRRNITLAMISSS